MLLTHVIRKSFALLKTNYNDLVDKSILCITQEAEM